MSVLIYNSIELSLIKTNSIERIARYSEDKTEYLWTDFIIDVTCIFNPAATSYPLAGLLPMQTDSSLRSALMQARQPLYFAEGGVPILEITGIDCENGPIPQYINIVRIGTSRIFWVNYVIKASIIECPIGSTPFPLQSNRYSRTESIDDDYISTLTTTGTAVFLSNVLEAYGNNADFYRAFIIPPPLYGYKRTNVVFTLDSNGIITRWATTDVEQKQPIGNLYASGTAASVGITKMGLNYITGPVSTGALGIASPMATSTVVCWAQGMRYANRYSMLLYCAKVAFEKLQNIVPIGMLIQGNIAEDVFNNRVEVTLTYYVVETWQTPVPGIPPIYAPIQGVVGLNLVMSLPSSGSTDLNPTPPFSNFTRGTAAYMLAVSEFANSLACAPCCGYPGGFGYTDATGAFVDPNAYSILPFTGIAPAIQAFYDPGLPVVSPNPGTVLQKGQNPRSIYGQSGVIRYNTRTSYENSQGIIQIPIASSVSNSSSSSSSGNPGSQNSSPSCVNIQLFQPITKQITDWTSTTIGQVPEVPDPTVSQDNSSNQTLLSNNISTFGLQIIADGANPVYTASGSYIYSLLTSNDLTSPISFDIPPNLNIQANQYTQIDTSDYTEGIINNNVQA